MYKQVKPFNQTTAGKVAGYCLQNVRKGFGIASKYPTATEAWNHTQQHKDRNIPTGVDVPLFYSYKSDGHVNIRLANGKVWSDGTTYDSLDAYISSHPAVSYLGWGESINDVSVLQYAPDPVNTPTKPSGMPAINSWIQLIPNAHSTMIRTTYKVGTANVAGHINVPAGDETYKYLVRGYDNKYPGRIIINSASGGGDGVGLALWYLNGNLIEGWKKV